MVQQAFCNFLFPFKFLFALYIQDWSQENDQKEG
uniref:Uncharacterized protein n=1 Tax=Anguilla anguilla TaxID=7936 RepID=A0A0E9V0R5_ANGAN